MPADHGPAEQVKNARDLHYELARCLSRCWRSISSTAGRCSSSSPPTISSRNGWRTDLVHPAFPPDRRVIAKHTGLEANPHLFRSSAAKIDNRIKPGDWGIISHVLQHELAATMRAYANFERTRSIRLYR